MESIYLGIDFGGSKLLAVLANKKGKVFGEKVLPISRQFEPKTGVDVIFDHLNELVTSSGCKMDEITGLGIAAAGAINRITGMIIDSPQLPAWNNVNLSKELHKRCKLPVAIDNDANLAALGEFIYGNGKGVNNLLYITVSTGIGIGIIINGMLYHGNHGYAGEAGQMIFVEKNANAQGRFVPWEAVSSGSGIAGIATTSLLNGAKSILQDLIKSRALSTKDVFDAYHEGDNLAQEIVQDATSHLGAGFASLVNIFDPNLLIIGGGLTNQWDTYIQPALAIMKEQCAANIERDLEICRPYLGARSGALGAISLISNELNS